MTSILERRSANGVGMMPGKDEIRENFGKAAGNCPLGASNLYAPIQGSG